MLALLVLRAGEVVSRDALVDALWGEVPPATAVKTLQGHVARVRRSLEAAGLGEVLVTRAPGYVLSVPAGSVDVTGFERHAMVGRGALAEGDASRAAAELGEALGLWRGDALADCRSGGWAATAGPAARRAAPLDRRGPDRRGPDARPARRARGRAGVIGGAAPAAGAVVGRVDGGAVPRRAVRPRRCARTSGRVTCSSRSWAWSRARSSAGSRPQCSPATPSWICPRPPQGVPRAELSIPFPGRLGAASSAVFVGRAQEREGLNRSLLAVAEGERRVVLVSGEPGIGKTSLAAAFAAGCVRTRRDRVVRAL